MRSAVAAPTLVLRILPVLRLVEATLRSRAIPVPLLLPLLERSRPEAIEPLLDCTVCMADTGPVVPTPRFPLTKRLLLWGNAAVGREPMATEPETSRAFLGAVVPIPRLPVMSAVPATSRRFAGAVVPMPR